jgi:hypothetical protein
MRQKPIIPSRAAIEAVMQAEGVDPSKTLTDQEAGRLYRLAQAHQQALDVGLELTADGNFIVPSAV